MLQVGKKKTAAKSKIHYALLWEQSRKGALQDNLKNGFKGDCVWIVRPVSGKQRP